MGYLVQRAVVFKFMKRSDTVPSPSSVAAVGDTELASAETAADATDAAVSAPEPSLPSPLAENELLSAAPITCVAGIHEARLAIQPLATSKPRSIWFIIAPRTSSHTAALKALLIDLVAPSSQDADTLADVIVTDFTSNNASQIVRMPEVIARALCDGVAQAILTLSHTLPAAFASDSAEVARLTLDEELRSGHDRVLDALKRKAEAQNIGIMRTPRGYTVAPMHDGRVVPPDVFKALPESLRADVDAKLAAFEGELSGVLADRSRMQRDHRARVIEFESEVATLAVRPAFADVKAKCAGHLGATGILEALSADLVTNAALFLPGGRRAPVDIINDPRLARYRVAVLARPGGLTWIDDLDAASVTGTVGVSSDPTTQRQLDPTQIEPGAFSRAGTGFVVVDSRLGLYSGDAWCALKHAFDVGGVTPVCQATGRPHRCAPRLAVDARLLVVGDADDCRGWHGANRELAPAVRLITAFHADVPRTPASERQLAGQIAGLIAQANALALTGPALAAVIEAMSTGGGPDAKLTTDLDALRAVLVDADAVARHDDHDRIEVEDVAAGIATRRDLQGVAPAVDVGL
jgi:predicted ATP-dependent protease